MPRLDLSDYRRKGDLIWIAGGLLLVLYALHAGHREWAVRDHGVETLAEVTAAERTTYLPFMSKAHRISLQWIDKKGEKRSASSRYISAEYRNQIVRDGTVAVARIPIKYLEDRPSADPLLVADPDQVTWYIPFVVVAVIGLLLVLQSIRRLLRAQRPQVTPIGPRG